MKALFTAQFVKFVSEFATILLISLAVTFVADWYAGQQTAVSTESQQAQSTN